jgi:hypothetical protein
MASPISVFDSILGAIQKAAEYNRRQIRCQEPIAGKLVEKHRFRFLTPFRFTNNRERGALPIFFSWKSLIPPDSTGLQVGGF